MSKNNLKKDYEENVSNEEKRIIDQVNSEFILSYDAIESKRAKNLKRLKLYNNQKRDEKKVGDPLLFAVFQTVFASLYNDRIIGVFNGREEGDEETAENLNSLAEYDYSIMEKDQLDYEWDWDTCFFGRGLLLLNEFDRRKNMAPVGEVIDPMTFIRDPRATSVNGNQKGFGGARFFGREICLTMSELQSNKSYFNLDKLQKDKDLQKSLTNEARKARQEAQGIQSTDKKEEALEENYEYNLLEWYTTIKGKKYIITLGNNRTLLIRRQKLKQQDKWAIIDRALFPISHDWDGVNIPDLIEDKQRAKAVMINLGMESAKADLYPMYIFDKTKIRNSNDLNFEFNKMIPVQGDVNNAIQPIQKSVFHQQVNLILNILDAAAQRAVAAPEIAQGVQPKKTRTLGENEMVGAGAINRHSLGARIFSWSEKKFWRQWYFLYKTNFKEDIDEKLIRLQGPLGPIWKTFTRENLISSIDPDVTVEIASIMELKKQKEYQEFSTFAQIAIQDPQVNRRYILRKLAQINGLKKAQIAMMFPPSLDEMRAEDENQVINENKLPKINFNDDDIVHIEIHNKAKDVKAKIAHIEAHKIMLMKKRENALLFQQQQQEQEQQSLNQKTMNSFSPIRQPQQSPQQSQPQQLTNQPQQNSQPF